MVSSVVFFSTIQKVKEKIPLLLLTRKSLMFMGEYSHSIDAKGRLIIPSRFRDELGANFVLTKGLDGCLSLYPQNEWRIFEKKLRDLPLISRNARIFTRFFVASATPCTFDKQGRILIPEILREYANLEKNVVLTGNINRIEIWSKRKWSENSNYDDMNVIAKELQDIGMII